MKITQVYRTRNGVVGPTNINGYGIIKVNGLRYDKDENKYYDSEDNEVILEEGREYYSNNKLYVYNGKLTQLLTDLMIEVKWDELVELRDNGELIPGCKYRITDVTNAFSPDSEYYGQQIDVIVEATSTNTLYEEAQAAMHKNIYDVTFTGDDVTRKCYLYKIDEDDDLVYYNIVDCETLIGVSYASDVVIDENNKTAETGFAYVDLQEENLTYNYFQNYNLSNWKVYYCLDNDKARFSWADDSVDGRGVIYEVKTVPDNHLIKVTWQELKDLRDNGKLIAGRFYRITDYQCTTTQENTRSAGHQFDIVVLALSENTLSEEAHAMMHDNIYDVYFEGDDVTKKCYVYPVSIDGDDYYNVIFIDTMIGSTIAANFLEINESNKTAVEIEHDSTEYATSDLTYNYFQNSKLESWKVWYCLDNDTTRFAWADDSVDEGSPASVKLSDNNIYIRDTSKDTRVSNKNYYGWTFNTTTYYSRTETGINGMTSFYQKLGTMMATIEYYCKVYTPYVPSTGIPNGRGVIYRLIDEWNNDCPYDFKNIQFVRKLLDGEIDVNGEDTYIPTFCLYDQESSIYKDASIFGIDYPDDEGIARPCCNNYIGSVLASRISIFTGIYCLPCTIFISKVEANDIGWNSRNNILYEATECDIIDSTNSIVISASRKTISGSVVLRFNSRVVWENA